LKNIAHDWLSWFELVYAVGKEKGDTGPAGPAGAAGADGATGPAGAAGSANINGTPDYLIKFDTATSGGDSISYQYGDETIKTLGRHIIKQLISKDVTIETGYSMIVGTCEVAAGVTVEVQTGAEIIAA
jgi:hypothetical protein